MFRGICTAAFILFASTLPSLADCIEGPPFAISDPAEIASGNLFWKDGRYLRYLKSDCYIYPKFFDSGRSRFVLYYYDRPTATDEGLTVDFVAVQIARRTPDRYDDGDIFKIDRNTTWYRFEPAGVEALSPISDRPVDVTLDRWNDLHAVAMTIEDNDAALGYKWHGSPNGEDSQTSSWNYHRLLALKRPQTAEDERLIVASLLLRYSSGGSGLTEIPFNGTIYPGTDIFAINYYFGNDPVVRSVRICRTSC